MNVMPDAPLLAGVVVIALVLAVVMLLAALRLLRGPSLPDRVVALDLIGTAAIGIMSISSVLTQERAMLNIAIVMALLLFLSTTAFALYIERRARP